MGDHNLRSSNYNTAIVKLPYKPPIIYPFETLALLNAELAKNI